MPGDADALAVGGSSEVLASFPPTPWLLADQGALEEGGDWPGDGTDTPAPQEYDW